MDRERKKKRTGTSRRLSRGRNLSWFKQVNMAIIKHAKVECGTVFSKHLRSSQEENACVISSHAYRYLRDMVALRIEP